VHFDYRRPKVMAAFDNVGALFIGKLDVVRELYGKTVGHHRSPFHKSKNCRRSLCFRSYKQKRRLFVWTLSGQQMLKGRRMHIGGHL